MSSVETRDGNNQPKQNIDDISSSWTADKKEMSLLTGTTLQLNSQVKSQTTKKQTFWTQLFTKARDSTIKESLTFARTYLQRLFCTHFFSEKPLFTPPYHVLMSRVWLVFILLFNTLFYKMVAA